MLLADQKKKNGKDNGDCQACDVLGDYMSAGTPACRPAPEGEKKKGQKFKES
jgi:hypothetical protein